jgi:hypothetical protein
VALPKFYGSSAATLRSPLLRFFANGLGGWARPARSRAMEPGEGVEPPSATNRVAALALSYPGRPNGQGPKGQLENRPSRAPIGSKRGRSFGNQLSGITGVHAPHLRDGGPGCGTSRAIDLRTVDRHPLASVGTLVLGLGCSWCPDRHRCRSYSLYAMPPAAASAVVINRLARLLGKRLIGTVLSEHTDEDGAMLFVHACRMGLEGIVSKRLSAPYRSGPSRDWIKVMNPDSPAMTRPG